MKLTDAQAHLLVRVAVVSTGISVGLSVILFSMKKLTPTRWMVVCVVAAALLAVGIHHGSVACAVGLCLMQGFNLSYNSAVTHRVPSPLALGFFAASLCGVAGTALLNHGRKPGAPPKAELLP